MWEGRAFHQQTAFTPVGIFVAMTFIGLPLHIEILYNECQMAASLVTLVLKYLVERRVLKALFQANEVGVPA